jgi:hypothetical protein
MYVKNHFHPNMHKASEIHEGEMFQIFKIDFAISFCDLYYKQYVIVSEI